MIGALREEMEKMRIGEQERLQQALAATGDEIGQLKEKVLALRKELERRKNEHEEKCQTIEHAAHEEARQLQEMIQAIR